MTKVRAAHVSYYFDADVLGPAKILAAIRPDVTYPGDPGGIIHKKQRPACIVATTNTLDDVWIPLVTEQGWLIITKDRHIQTRVREIQAVRDHGARMVALAGTEAIGTFNQLEIIMRQWRRIQACLDEAGPFIYRATRTSFKPVDLGR